MSLFEVGAHNGLDNIINSEQYLLVDLLFIIVTVSNNWQILLWLFRYIIEVLAD
jgi:hypothetical protein